MNMNDIIENQNLILNGVNFKTREEVFRIFVRLNDMERMDRETTGELPKGVKNIEGEPFSHSDDESV